MIVFTVRPQNDKILIVSDKFWDKIVCDIFRHFKYLSQVRPRPKLLHVEKFNTHSEFNSFPDIYSFFLSILSLYIYYV